MKTQQINFRLSETARNNLAVICETSGVNQTAAVELSLAALSSGLTRSIPMEYHWSVGQFCKSVSMNSMAIEMQSIEHEMERIEKMAKIPYSVWNQAQHYDVNWAFQQIRPDGKPAGDIEKHNNRAQEILFDMFPGKSPDYAGELAGQLISLVAKLSVLRSDYQQMENALSDSAR